MNYNEFKQLVFELIDKLEQSRTQNVSIEFEQARISISKATAAQWCRRHRSLQAATSRLQNRTTKLFFHQWSAPLLCAVPRFGALVRVGDKICKGDTICIIEAMKLMNEIEADKSGIIKEYLWKTAKRLNQPAAFHAKVRFDYAKQGADRSSYTAQEAYA